MSKSKTGFAQSVEGHRRELVRLLADGLHPAYKSWDEFMIDYHPDFSWSNPRPELQACLDDAEWMRLAGEVKAKYGVDFAEEHRQAISEDAEG